MIHHMFLLHVLYPLIMLLISSAMHVVFHRDEFAYAASDKLVYIRQFSDEGSKMKLTGILQGHEADVTQVFFLVH